MKRLKHIVNGTLQRISILMLIVILLVSVYVQILETQNKTKDNAAATFLQIEHILRENKAELTSIEENYRESCLLNAEVIAYIIQHHPDILGNTTEFRKLAYMMQVDEIHVFDNTGRIFTGTHPEYFDFTFDSGEQINFFKPMMDDKSLRLCQDITPNTAEGRLVQYSALWSSDENFIVQIGMYPDTVLETTRKNELSYIFSLLQGSPGISLYAIDLESETVVGSTSGTDNGKKLSQIGISLADTQRRPNGIHLTVNGVYSYCVFTDLDNTRIGYIIATDTLYHAIPVYTCVLALCLIIIITFFTYFVQKFTNRYIIGSISAINQKLSTVAEGNLDERVDVQSSIEFAELSNHINHMIHSILAGTDKMSMVLDHTNMRIGVYEYNHKMKTVRFTEHVAEIFGLTQKELNELSSDYKQFQNFIDCVQNEPVNGAENTYRLSAKEDMYIKLEEVSTDGDVLGIVMDVTEDTLNLRRAERERDLDLLTGIYNRRGMERRFDLLFETSETIGIGALVMIDSDDMKFINDTYGHAVGDLYLQKIAELLVNFESPRHLAARLGGDEFVLLVYGYKSRRNWKTPLPSFMLSRKTAS